MNSAAPILLPGPRDSAAVYTELEQLGEIRSEWINNPRYVRRTVWFYAPLVGALGVLFGYVLYFQTEPMVHDGLTINAIALVVGLLAAAGLGALSEWIRQVIDDGADRLLPSSRIMIITILTLVLFELFIASAHSFVEQMLGTAEGSSVFKRAFGDIFTGKPAEFIVLALFWTIPSIVLAGTLSRAIFRSRGTRGAQSRKGALFGLAAVLISAILILGSILTMNALHVAYEFVFDHREWRDFPSRQSLASVLGLRSNHLSRSRVEVGTLYTVIALLTVTMFFGMRRMKSLKSGTWKLLLAAIGILGVVVTDWTLVKVPIYISLVWSVPATFLGAMVPWLRTSSQLDRRFATVLLVLVPAAPAAYFGGCFVLRWYEFHLPIVIVTLIPAGILLAAHSEIRRERILKEYWPLAALAAGFCGFVFASLLLYPANSLPIFKDIHGLNSQGDFRAALFGEEQPPSKKGYKKPSKGPEPGEPSLESESPQEKAKDLRLSQLCIIGSTSFWVTASLVLVWSIRLTQDRTCLQGEKRRCFWAVGGGSRLIEYHDGKHGTPPHDDDELFARLALELLTDGAPWKDDGEYAQIFQGFAPSIVAQMNASDVCDAARKSHLMKGGSIFSDASVYAIIENARRLNAYVGDPSNSPLVRTLQTRAVEGPAAVISFLRKIFVLDHDFPVGSFLQGINVLPGSHFRGCWLCHDGSEGEMSSS